MMNECKMTDGYCYEGEWYTRDHKMPGYGIPSSKSIIEEAAIEAKDEAEAWKELDEMSINELYGVSWEN